MSVRPATEMSVTERFGPATASKVRAFLNAEQASPTNLLSLDKYAAELGLGNVYVKDESNRTYR